jgi:hypothetical protein
MAIDEGGAARGGRLAYLGSDRALRRERQARVQRPFSLTTSTVPGFSSLEKAVRALRTCPNQCDFPFAEIVPCSMTSNCSYFFVGTTLFLFIDATPPETASTFTGVGGSPYHQQRDMHSCTRAWFLERLPSYSLASYFCFVLSRRPNGDVIFER